MTKTRAAIERFAAALAETFTHGVFAFVAALLASNYNWIIALQLGTAMWVGAAIGDCLAALWRKWRNKE